MSCLKEQTNLNDILIKDDCLSPQTTTNGELDKICLDEQSIGSLQATTTEEAHFRLRLRNGLRSQLKSDTKNVLISSLQGNVNSNANNVKKLGNSLFYQLIKEAKTKPTSDFELCNSFFETTRGKTIALNELQNDDRHNVQAGSSKKINKRKDHLELLDDHEEQTEPDHRSIQKSQLFNMKESVNDSLNASNLKRQKNPEDSSLKELRNFKNLKNANQNGLIKSNDGKAIDKQSLIDAGLSRLQVKPTQKIFINSNLFKYNDGLVSADSNYNWKHPSNSANKYLLKKKNQTYVFENIQERSKKDTSHAKYLDQRPNQCRLNNLLNRFKNSSPARRSYFSISSQHNRTDLANKDSSTTLNSLNQELINRCMFRSTNDSPVFDFFTFQDQVSSDLERDECQTSIVALVQVEQISIWTKLPSQTEWAPHFFLLEGNQQVFRCTKIDKENYVCVLFLVCSFSLVSLKYCFIDKRTKSARLVHGETFELSNTDLNLIQLCFMSPNSIALSIPRINENIIDVLVYDQVDFQTEFNKSKRIIYMLNNMNNKFSSWNNCFLVSDELDDTFLAIFNQKLYVCNAIEYNKIPKMISLQKFTNLEYSYFDVLYDKGIFYLFAGNMFMNYVRIIALNPDRCLVEKLIKYDIEKALEEDRLNNRLEADDCDEEPERGLPLDQSNVKLFKRKGDYLLIAKSDSTVALYNLCSDKIVYQSRLSDINETAIAVLNQRTTILAVLNSQIIIDL